jgi:hypothetical protein
MRDPSLHITRSELIKLLNEAGCDKGHSDIEWLANFILKKAYKKSPTARHITVSNDRMEKKIKKVLASSISDAELFSMLLMHKRKSLKHKGITQIKAGSRDWNTIKEITVIANEFCETHKLDKREGYIEFINIGTERMAKFMVVKFLNMGGSIMDIYGYKRELAKDDKKDQTKSLHDFYQHLILSKTGLSIQYLDKPEKYVYFYRSRLQANKLGISGQEYIKAQFYALEWRQGYPDPIQLVGEKALQNLNKYLYEKGISIKKDTHNKIDWGTIKSLGGDRN